MSLFGDRRTLRFLLPTAFVAGALTFFPVTWATEAATSENLSTPENRQALENSRPGPIGLGVTGASAGITTEYFEKTLADELGASGIFSGIDSSKSAEFVMPMLRTKGVFSGSAEIGDTPYFLNVRVIHVETPSFSLRMTVSMNAVWTLYRVADKTELMHENIQSTYTGGFFEGGIHGANRVRVAMEGAERENVRIGIGTLAALDLEQEDEQTQK
jgi:hypothetical protein